MPLPWNGLPSAAIPPKAWAGITLMGTLCMNQRTFHPIALPETSNPETVSPQSSAICRAIAALSKLERAPSFKAFRQDGAGPQSEPFGLGAD